jgi:dephospho-CoA kinase
MQQPVRLIGVTGTAGSGKDTASDLLCELFDFTNMSTSEFVRVLTRQIYGLAPGFNPIRDQLYEVANYVRTTIDPAFFVKMAIFEGQQQGHRRIVVSGLRSMGEADAVRAAGGLILAVDADPQVRYERITGRGRDAETHKTFDQFLAHDQFENKGVSTTGPGRGIQHIIDSADLVIANSAALDDLKQALRDQLGPLL